MSSICLSGIRLFLFFIFSFTSLPAALANVKVEVSFDMKFCEKFFLEAQAPKPFDYAVSDLEGLYLAIVEEAKDLNVKDEKAMERFLKRKATFLNHLGVLASKLRYDFSSGSQVKIGIDQIANMLLSIGVSPQIFGIEVDSSFGLSIHPNAQAFDQRAHGGMVGSRKAVKNPPIGFIHFDSEKEDPLPSHRHRTIGFAPQKVESYDPPKRVGGQIRFHVNYEDDSVLIVDLEGGTRVEVKLSVMQDNGFENEDRVFHLSFAQDQSEWLVSFESKVNPDGKIGFR